MRKKQRSINQINENQSFSILREKLPKEWVVHPYGEDYGIDYVVELFDYVGKSKKIAETLGEIFFVQLKSSTSINYGIRKVYPRYNVEKKELLEDDSECIEIKVARFKLEMPEILTIQSMGSAIPVLLILIDIVTSRVFFVCLNDYIDKVLIPEDKNYFRKKHKTLYIPLKNEILDTEDNLLPLRVFAKRSKMYGAFGKFHYQRNEIKHKIQEMLSEISEIDFLRKIKIDHESGGIWVAPDYLEKINSLSQEQEFLNNSEIEHLQQSIDMVSIFLRITLSLDIWRKHDFWPVIPMLYKKLKYLQILLDQNEDVNEYKALLFYAKDLWDKLTVLNNLYEEMIREHFLPTFLSQKLNS